MKTSDRTPFPYREVFNDIEARLLEQGSSSVEPSELRRRLNRYKFAGSQLTDEECFGALVLVAFYSGFKAETVTTRRAVIKKHFPSWQAVASYTEGDVKLMLADRAMIRHESKIRGCISNAQAIERLVADHGSIARFIASHAPSASFENLMLLKETLESQFSYLGGVTVYHFMTDLGLPVLKPDRVICRLFHRLGLLENERQLLKAVIQGRKFAEATGHPIRYIDVVLVAYGQAQSSEFGLSRGICLLEPRCSICPVQQHCSYPQTATLTASATSRERAP